MFAFNMVFQFVLAMLEGENVITYFNVTQSLVQPLVESINSALTTMVPIGLGIMSSFIGVNILKRIIWSFL